MAIPRLDLKHTALLVVDIQEKLLPHMHNTTAVVAQAGRLIDGARLLKLPIIVTEQYRKGLGVTVPELASKLTPPAPGSAPAPGSNLGTSLVPAGEVTNYEKLKFSACIEPVREQLAKTGVRAVLVCGIEAHVCVLQTCLDLAQEGYLPFLVVDAIGSRRALDQAAAEARMTQAGVLPTTVESALLEMVHEAGGAMFKAILPVIK